MNPTFPNPGARSFTVQGKPFQASLSISLPEKLTLQDLKPYNRNSDSLVQAYIPQDPHTLLFCKFAEAQAKRPLCHFGVSARADGDEGRW